MFWKMFKSICQNVAETNRRPTDGKMWGDTVRRNLTINFVCIFSVRVKVLTGKTRMCRNNSGTVISIY
ncbi:hypothetical protein WN48_10151 [Eufriesea mexicana]|nr:hypothetical protein WN48_10151 [Eufriesea mexicana]